MLREVAAVNSAVALPALTNSTVTTPEASIETAREDSGTPRAMASLAREEPTVTLPVALAAAVTVNWTRGMPAWMVVVAGAMVVEAPEEPVVEPPD